MQPSSYKFSDESHPKDTDVDLVFDKDIPNTDEIEVVIELGLWVIGVRSDKGISIYGSTRRKSIFLFKTEFDAREFLKKQQAAGKMNTKAEIWRMDEEDLRTWCIKSDTRYYLNLEKGEYETLPFPLI